MRGRTSKMERSSSTGVCTELVRASRTKRIIEGGRICYAKTTRRTVRDAAIRVIDGDVG